MLSTSRQDAEAAREGHAPLLVRRLRRRRLRSRHTDRLLAGFEPQREPVEPIEPVDALDVDRPAFPPQQGMHPPIAIAHAHRGDLADALTQRRLILVTAAIAIPHPLPLDDRVRPSFADPKALL